MSFLKKIGILKPLSICFTLVFSQNILADTKVNVVGLFDGRALLMIDGGAPKTLSVGQTVGGVKLLAADSASATILVEGKRKVLAMGQAANVGGDTAADSNQAVQIFADSRGHFLGNMLVNGVTLKYVVDTGATSIAMNSADAKHARIDYTKGQKVPVSTANGITNAFLVRLNTVKLGGITLNNVEALVQEGGFPDVVLLGMSALNRLEMTRDNSVMTLKKKY